MEVKELKLRLLEELEKEQPDRQTVMNFLELLKESSPAELPEEISPGVEAAWKRFREKRDGTKPKKLQLWMKVAAAAAVLCLVIFAAPPVFGAENLCELLGRWTDDIFTFAEPSQTTAETQDDYTFQTDHPGLRQIYNTAAELGITQPVIPMWVPEGYELNEVTTSTVKEGTWIHALCVCEDENINISVLIRSGAVATNYTKDQNDASWVELFGIAHYMVSNDGKQVVAWSTDNLECCISVSDENVNIMKILYSVYKGEE